MLSVMGRSNVMFTIGIGNSGRMEYSNAITRFMLEI